jgi:GTP-binding protein EngB required for normal cell division
MNMDKEMLKKKLEESAQEKVNIAFFGPPGSGKSSTINALCGADVVTVGVNTDTTLEAKVIEHGELAFIDLPGYGTAKFPQKDFFAKFNPLQYDLFICVFDGKLRKSDTEFFQVITKADKPCIFVRNKIDEIYDEDKTTAQSQDIIRQDLAGQIGKEDFSLLFICARGDMLKSIEELQNSIISKMNAARKEKYYTTAKVLTEEYLQGKKELAMKCVSKSAQYAALNGLNPVLGVDAAIDAAIIYNMYTNIRKNFDINEKMVVDSILTITTKNFLLKGMSKNGVTIILKSITKKLVSKSVFKYIPLVGQATAVCVGYKIIKETGEKYALACYQAAQEDMLEELNAKK